MSLILEDLRVPIRVDEGGTARIAGTRVSLDTLIGEFRQGATPEQILQDFDSLSLADIYAVIAFYLTHTAAVDAYLRKREQEADEIRRQMENLYPSQGIRERLLARRKEPA